MELCIYYTINIIVCYHRGLLFYFYNQLHNIGSMSNPYQQIMLGIVMSQVVISTIFLVLYAIRICKLDRLASTDLYKKARSLWIKILLIAFLIIIDILHIVLSFFDPNYWLYGSRTEYFSFAQLICIICLVLQIYILKTEHYKQAVITKLIPLQWIIVSIFQLTEIIVTLILKPTYTTIIPILAFLDLLALIGVVLWYKQLKPVQDTQFTINQTLIPLVHTSSHPQNEDRLYIQFNKQFQISIKNSKATCCMFKFAVYVGDQSRVLSKPEQAFADLQRQMLLQFPQDKYLLASDIIQKLRMFQGTSLMKYGQEKQKICQDYLAYITSEKKYYNEILLDFLEIPHQRRHSLIRRRRFMMKKNSEHSNNISSNNSSDPSERQIGQPFFKVYCQQGQFYISNPQVLTIKIDRTYPEIREFHDNLLASRKLKSAIIISDYYDQTQMINFIFRCVNFKHMWKYFAQWIGLGVKLENRVYNMYQFWNYGFYHLNMSIIGHEVDFDANGQVHALYLISISTKPDKDKGNKKSECKILKKRNTDFTKLHKALQKHFARQQIKKTLPALPPKLTFFGSKTSTKSRQIYFDHYIKQLFKTAKINHSVKFLEFLEMDGEYPFEFFPPKSGLASAENSMLQQFLNNLENHKQRQQRSQG